MPSGLIHLPAVATPAVVSVNSTGSTNVNSGGGNPISTQVTITIVDGPSRRLYVPVFVGHSNWLNSYNAGSPSATSDIDGPLTQVGSTVFFGDVAGFRQGSTALFELADPSVDDHTITLACQASQALSVIAGTARCYDNVGSSGTPVTQASTSSNAALNLSVTPNEGDLALMVAAFNGTPTLTNDAASPWYSEGGTYSGDADQFRGAEVSGTGAAVSFTASNALKVGAIALVLVVT